MPYKSVYFKCNTNSIFKTFQYLNNLNNFPTFFSFFIDNFIAIYRVRHTPFFWKMLKKKLLNIFSNFVFLFESTIQSFQLIIQNNFFQMAASAGHAVANTIGPIFKHIIVCVQLYFTQWLHKYCLLKRQLSLACRHNNYL